MANLIAWWGRFRCNVLGWHTMIGGRVTFNGASLISRCARCDRRIAQDSQGNWFEIGGSDA